MSDTEIIIVPEGHRLCRGCVKYPECNKVIPYVKMRVRCSDCYSIYKDARQAKALQNFELMMDSDHEEERPHQN